MCRSQIPMDAFDDVPHMEDDRKGQLQLKLESDDASQEHSLHTNADDRVDHNHEGADDNRTGIKVTWPKIGHGRVPYVRQIKHSGEEGAPTTPPQHRVQENGPLLVRGCREPTGDSCEDRTESHMRGILDHDDAVR